MTKEETKVKIKEILSNNIMGGRLDIVSATNEITEMLYGQDDLSLKEIKQKVELDKINEVLATVKWNRSKAAKILGIDRKTLYNKIKAKKYE